MDGVDYHPSPGISAALNERLLAAMRANPDATTSFLGGVIGRSPGAIVGRLRRLGRKGALVQCANGRWRLPQPGEQPSAELGEQAPELETAERARPPYDPSRWVQHIDYFVRVSTSMFACARFG
jgi:hypothetical protein